MRRKTEEELRHAQEGLIHSEKMAALGRMSAAIVHEVSQPLAALDATLATAGVLAGKQEAGAAGEGGVLGELFAIDDGAAGHRQ